MAEEIITNVAGVTYANEDGTKRQDLLRGMTTRYKIKLRDEACAEHPEAIGVYNARGKRLGFLPKHIAQHIRECGIEYIDLLDAKITFVGAELGKPIGMQIAIEGEDLEPYGLNKHPSPYRYAESLSESEKEEYLQQRENAISNKIAVKESEKKKLADQAQREAERLSRQLEYERQAAERRWEEKQREAERNARNGKIGCWLVVVAVCVMLGWILYYTVDTFSPLFK